MISLPVRGQCSRGRIEVLGEPWVVPHSLQRKPHGGINSHHASQ